MRNYPGNFRHHFFFKAFGGCPGSTRAFYHFIFFYNSVGDCIIIIIFFLIIICSMHIHIIMLQQTDYAPGTGAIRMFFRFASETVRCILQVLGVFVTLVTYVIPFYGHEKNPCLPKRWRTGNMLLSLLFKVLRYSNCEPEIIDLCDNLSQQYAIAVRNRAFSAHKLCLIILTSVISTCFLTVFLLHWKHVCRNQTSRSPFFQGRGAGKGQEGVPGKSTQWRWMEMIF